MITRLANYSDLNDVLEIMDLCKKDLVKRGLNIWDDNYPTKDMIIDDLNKGNSVVCEEDNKVLSFMAVLPNHLDEHEECFKNHDNFCLVKRVMVHTNHRRKGLAMHMFKYLETLGYKSIRLTARDSNTFAVNLYNKLNYNKKCNVEYPWAIMGVYEKELY